MVLKGSAKVSFESGTIEMKPGDSINIRAHQKHRVEWTNPAENTIWLAVFYPSSRQANLNYVSRNLREQTKNQNSHKQIQFQEQ